MFRFTNFSIITLSFILFSINNNDLKKRFLDWSIQVVFFLRELPKAEEHNIVRYQLIKSSSSSAANYRAACRAKSAKDFLNKLKIVEEELDESLFWFDFIEGIEPNWSKSLKPLFKEGNELLSIIVSSIKTTRRKINS